MGSCSSKSSLDVEEGRHVAAAEQAAKRLVESVHVVHQRSTIWERARAVQRGESLSLDLSELELSVLPAAVPALLASDHFAHDIEDMCLACNILQVGKAPFASALARLRGLKKLDLEGNRCVAPASPSCVIIKRHTTGLPTHMHARARAG
jgi:hypothetical protein